MSEAPFFGRAGALEELGDRLARVARSEPQIVLVDGPAGIGKTSLVRHFLASVHAGCQVLRTSGEEMEMHLPYGVAAQLLAHARRVVDVPEKARAHHTLRRSFAGSDHGGLLPAGRAGPAPGSRYGRHGDRRRPLGRHPFPARAHVRAAAAAVRPGPHAACDPGRHRHPAAARAAPDPPRRHHARSNAGRPRFAGAHGSQRRRGALCASPLGHRPPERAHGRQSLAHQGAAPAASRRGTQRGHRIPSCTACLRASHRRTVGSLRAPYPPTGRCRQRPGYVQSGAPGGADWQRARSSGGPVGGDGA
ncbi:ATP-binding protein [Streptomyces sp. NPDC048251]|uniref:ATP-binding protein n=1 Tax=Streptomyces sp. NPDC048251 TaxID=3154501 RepID=UPI00343A3BD9